MMRTLLFVILISGQCFGQIFEEQPDLRFPGKVDSVLLGDWYLKETIIASAYKYDSVPIIRDFPSEFKTISVTPDSLIINPWETRYYRRYERFAYQIQDADLNLYQGAKKKKEKVATYGIVKYSPREFIISNQEHLSDPFDNNSLTIYHIYHRDDLKDKYESLLNKFSTKWIICSNESIPFLKSDTSCILDFRMRDSGYNYANDICSDSVERIVLSYYRDENNFQNKIKGSWSTKHVGSVLDFPFYFDRTLENIIVPGRKNLAYKIGLFETNQLTLELNKELTEQLNKEHP